MLSCRNARTTTSFGSLTTNSAASYSSSIKALAFFGRSVVPVQRRVFLAALGDCARLRGGMVKAEAIRADSAATGERDRSGSGKPPHDDHIDHGDDHDVRQPLMHEHNKPWYRDSANIKLLVMVALSTIFMGGELGVGFWTDSLALISDAFHMLSDVLSLIVGIAARVVRCESLLWRLFQTCMHPS